MKLPEKSSLLAPPKALGAPWHCGLPRRAYAYRGVGREDRWRQETARLCRINGAAARAYTVDVGNAEQIETAVSRFRREWGKPAGS